MAELPFLRGGGENRIFVDLAAEGSRKLVLLLDTGASDSIVTPRYARQLGVSIRRDKSSPYRRKTLLGKDLLFWVDDRHSDTSSRSFEHGLLGGTFLSKYVVELDFGDRAVRLYDPKKFEVPEEVNGEDVDSFRFELAGNRPFIRVPATDGSEKQVRLLLDTGAWMPLLLSGKAAGRLGLENAPVGQEVSLRVPAGEMAGYQRELPSFRLRSFELRDVQTFVSPTGAYNQGGSDDSVIGYGLLSQFKVRIDYPRRRLWLKRVAFGPVFSGGFRTEPEAPATLIAGARTHKRGKNRFVVLSVAEGSAADRRGVVLGDEFLVSELVDVEAQVEEIARKLSSGEALEVAREIDGISSDVELPSTEAIRAER